MDNRSVKSYLVPINGIFVGIALVFTGWVAVRKLWAVEALLVAAAFSINGGIFQIGEIFKVSAARTRVAFFALTSFVLFYIGRQLVQDLSIFATADRGLIGALDYNFKNLCLFLTLVAIFWTPKGLPQAHGLASLFIGVGVWAATNLTLDWLDLTPADAEVVFAESRFDFALYRWLPPIIRSNWSFSANCSIAVVVSLVLLMRTLGQQRGNWTVSVRFFLFVAIIAAAIASIRCQFRAQLLLLPMMISWVLFARWRQSRVGIILLLVSCFTLAPFLLSGNRGPTILSAIGLDVLVERMGSKTADVLTLSGRTELYDFGLERLTKPAIALWGEGPSLRDSGVITSFDTGAARRGISYHSGFLDLLLTHGALLAAVLAAVIGGCLWRLLTSGRSRFLNGSGYDLGADLTLLYFSSWLTLSISDPGMFQYCDSFLLATVPLFGALRCNRPTRFIAGAALTSRLTRNRPPAAKRPESALQIENYDLS